ncbi:MAG TPA: hypothetical protein VMB77_11855, partial [Syntrophales bacterium]|nr:hypothetical protein [Syntrophales bacterium]
LLCVQSPDFLIDLLEVNEKGYLFFQSWSPGLLLILVALLGNKKCTDVGAFLCSCPASGFEAPLVCAL